MSNKFNSGSVKELWKMSFPMMISFFSISAMVFVDRIFLSMHSKEALSAAVTAGTLSWAFIACVLTLTVMSEVFVSQFNGAKKYAKLGSPSWQMLWLCLFSFILFIPAALFIAPLAFPAATSPLENTYFIFFMCVGPFFCINTALAGFFVGRGYPKLIQWMAIISNVVNIILDPIFIFGIDGYFPAFGMIGAAYATLIATLVQVTVIFIVFVGKKNHEKFNTRNWKFDKKLFLSCIKVGLPPAAFILMELTGWTVFYVMMKGISESHIFVAGICQSILILFFFFGWGIEKGCIALAGNFIGQKKPHLLKNVLRSSISILGIFFIFLSLILIIFPEPLVNWFFNSSLAVNEHGVSTNLSPEVMQETKNTIYKALIAVTFYIIIENVRWAIKGLLTAAGDTMFLLISGTASLWLFLFIPTYFFVYLPKAPVLNAFIIQVVYASASLGLFYFRFWQGKWKTKSIMSDDNKELDTPIVSREVDLAKVDLAAYKDSSLNT